MKPVAAKAVPRKEDEIFREATPPTIAEERTQVLRQAQFFRRPAQVLNSSEDETPLHHRGPKEDGFRSCSMHTSEKKTNDSFSSDVSFKNRGRADQQDGS